MKIKYITHLTLLFLLISSISFGQEVQNKTYRIVNPELVDNTNIYINAFSTADMTIFRYADKSNIIEFESGLKVELFSANKLTSKGIAVDFSKILTTEPSNKGDYVFDISANGKYILQKFTRTEFKRR